MTSITAQKAPIAVELEQGKTYYRCTCGKSANAPFCDGSHQGTGAAPQAFTAEKTGTAYVCTCNHSANTPFCDGAHTKL